MPVRNVYKVMDMKQPFERIVADNAVTVLRVCRAVVGVHDGDDAWSETFISAMRAYPDLAEDANVEAWLVTIAHRKAIDILRQQQRRESAMGSEIVNSAEVGVSIAIKHELWDLVRTLPERQRQAVAYHYLGGLPYSEVAEILGGSVDAARRAAADGMKSLRSMLVAVSSKGEAQ
jgi:RNA polymerase sigma factor (sigma-70 family)